MASKVPTLTVEMWSDIVCPFCFIGKRKLELALKQLQFVPYSASAAPDAKTYKINFRAFELDPTTPAMPNESLSVRLSKKFGMPEPQAVGMLGQMEETFKEVGLTFNWKVAKPGNTMDAHRLIHMAQDKGLGEAAKERMLLAYFTQGVPIGDPEALRKVASEIEGLTQAEIDAVLDDKKKHFDDVRADEEKARSMGVSGVPYFLLNGKEAISGAQDPATMARTIQKAL